MATPAWEPGTLYAPGSLVQRRSVPAATAQAITNPSFESGNLTGWSTDGEPGWTVDTGGYSGGTHFARYKPGYGIGFIYASAPAPCNPGQSITAKCMVMQGAAARGNAGGRVQLRWYNSSMIELSVSDGSDINSSDGGTWRQSTVTATAPAGAAFVAIGARVFQQESGKSVGIDAFQWNHTYAISDLGLVYRAVQSDPGYSGSTEPSWPNALGIQVIDNEVTWEAVDSAYVTWEAVPILKSGSVEPNWPEEVGASVDDGTIRWTAVSRRVEDENCPNSKEVLIAASKIFAADDDIIAFSATTNPLDWTTRDDAGYLPYGLRQFGSNPVRALALYRGNLCAFNAEGFQLWQVDEDPASMAILDSAPVGAIWPKAQQPVGNDLMLLGAVGVRNLSLAAASANLQSGSTGEPIDPLVTAAIRTGDYEPISLVYPAHGQYWLIFGPQAFVFTSSSPGKGTWSRYTFPEAITDATLLGDTLYLRAAGGEVWEFTEDEVADDVYCQGGPPILTGDYYGLAVDLAWTYDYPEFDVETFRILRSTDGSLFVEIDYVDGDTFVYTDATVQAGHDYAYMIVARPNLDEALDSAPSNIYPVTIAAVAPPPVLSGEVVGVNAALEWTAAGSATGSTVTGYELWRSEDGGVSYTLRTTTDGVTLAYDDPIDANVTYRYYVVAVSNLETVSPNSNVVTLLRDEDAYIPPTWINEGAEYGNLTGWTVTTGSPGVVARPAVGTYAFWGAQSALAEMHQDFVIPAGPWQDQVDAGHVRVTVDWWSGYYDMAFIDVTTLTLYALDAGGNALASNSTISSSGPWVAIPPGSAIRWNSRQTRLNLPAGTRSVRVRLRFTRNSGTNNDAAADEIVPRLEVY